MAKKKDFSGIPTDLTGAKPGRAIGGSISRGTSARGQQGTSTPEEAQERREALRTQGRKGVKAIRINMAFTPANHEFIKVLARATGRTMTELTNQVIAAYRNEHPEFMAQAAGFLEYINSGVFSSIGDPGSDSDSSGSGNE